MPRRPPETGHLLPLRAGERHHRRRPGPGCCCRHSPDACKVVAPAAAGPRRPCPPPGGHPQVWQKRYAGPVPPSPPRPVQQHLHLQVPSDLAVPLGAVFRTERGRMRNEWFPTSKAEYLTSMRLRRLGIRPDDIGERDRAYFPLPPVIKVVPTQTPMPIWTPPPPTLKPEPQPEPKRETLLEPAPKPEPPKPVLKPLTVPCPPPTAARRHANR